ncbi:glycoside hydrolase family 88 protein [Candidatus Sumerlaeota bacterium]|nr:glycoside hydrolase family 88 protein [Candidatus Sumerlaeota bacterium]
MRISAARPMAGMVALIATFLVAATVLAAPPGPASNPGPANGATNVDINETLTWTVGSGATAHDVYLGRENPPPYQGRVTTNAFIPGTFGRDRSYFWRVDEVDGTDVTTGTVWSFTTESSASVEERYKWAQWICQSLFNMPGHATPTSYAVSPWDYPEALYLSGIYEVWKETGGPMTNYLTDYMQPWADRTVQSDGSLSGNYQPLHYNLDYTSPGRALMAVYTETGQAKYLTGVGHIFSDQLASHRRNDEGGYWHKASVIGGTVYWWQMWLDGVYMAEPMTTWYAQTTGLTQWADEATSQILLIAQHAQDPATGLLYHGYFEYGTGHSPVPAWADPVTGCNPEFWGRAMGWYISAIVDVLDRIPSDHYNRAAIIQVLQDLVEGLDNFQDHDTGMWYQVVDKGYMGDNWVETSCSLFFSYGIAKAVQKGYVDPKYLENAWRGYRGVLNNKVDSSGANLILYGTVTVGSLGGSGGFYDYYVNSGLTVNDEKGVGALIYTALQMSRMADVDLTTPILHVDTGSIAFGTQDHNDGPTSTTFTLSNDALATGSLYVSLGDITGTYADEFSAVPQTAVSLLAPGESVVVTVTWTPTAIDLTVPRDVVLPIAHNDPARTSPFDMPIGGTPVPVEVSLFRVE